MEKSRPVPIYETMGGRLHHHEGTLGVRFMVWAPRARKVSVVGDFNGWDSQAHPMERRGDEWELFIPGIEEGARYKYAIESEKGGIRMKADPFAFQGEMRPNTASVVERVDRHQWQDQKWMEVREKGLEGPLHIYEVHLGSWKKGDGEFINYREAAPILVDYVKKMGFTHIEFMPLMGHPFDESWGYQVSGYYAISRRYGTVEDFQFLVDTLHQAEIGVIMDWVPGHFPTDEHSLAQFDGSYLYEHEDPRLGFHPQWNTHIFDFGKKEVVDFLVGSALFYLDKMHVDGLRVDAVSSMVYLDFARKEGEWLPNEKGGNENLEAIGFLQRLNKEVREKFPSALMIAEESHAFPGVTSAKGLGFDLRWDLGWMNDTLKFFQTDHNHRHAAFHHLTHEKTYYYDEKHLLPLSHDEVVHEKKSLLSKMPGNEWEKFANLRLLLSYQLCHPGKKLLFMGGEIGQWHEWNCKEELHWDVLVMSYHHQLQAMVAALGAFYQAHPAIFGDDFSKKGFEWIDTSDETNCVLSYLRKGGGETLLCIHHFSPEEIENYLLPFKGEAEEIFSSDSKEYGGYGIMNPNIHVEKQGIRLTLPPLATLILNV